MPPMSLTTNLFHQPIILLGSPKTSMHFHRLFSFLLILAVQLLCLPAPFPKPGFGVPLPTIENTFPTWLSKLLVGGRTEPKASPFQAIHNFNKEVPAVSAAVHESKAASATTDGRVRQMVRDYEEMLAEKHNPQRIN